MDKKNGLFKGNSLTEEWVYFEKLAYGGEYSEVV